jgi:predicted RNA-binding Zn ribbon-like protein
VSSRFPDSKVEREAELLIAFVNTYDPDVDEDALGDPPGLAEWMSASGFEVDDSEVGSAEQRRAVALRESVRSLLLANNGREARDVELAALQDAAAQTRFGARLTGAGGLELVPQGGGLAALEARLVLAIERLQARGAWDRLKACADETCKWAFFDSSRNRSRTWCSMEVCGNLSKTRRYRRRRSAGRGEASGRSADA